MDPLKRLEVAENAIKLLSNGELPCIEEFVFNSTFEIRVPNDDEKFFSLVRRDPNLDELNESSSSIGYAKVALVGGSPHITSYCRSQLSSWEANVFARLLGEMASAVLASVGLLSPPQSAEFNDL